MSIRAIRAICVIRDSDHFLRVIRDSDIHLINSVIQTPGATTMLKYPQVTQKIIGAAYEVYNVLGNGFQEVIYHRALAYELERAGLTFDREIEQELFYKDLPHPIGTRRADFVVEGKVLVELKAITQLEDVHLAQVLNYLKAYRLEVGLLCSTSEARA